MASQLALGGKLHVWLQEAIPNLGVWRSCQYKYLDPKIFGPSLLSYSLIPSPSASPSPSPTLVLALA